MNDEKDILERYLWILCNDFVVERKPGLIYIPSEKKVGISGLYNAKTETIILYVNDYDALIHEFIHHLQYEWCGYDYEKYLKYIRREKNKPHLKRDYEIEAYKVEHILSSIYESTFSRGIDAEPLGNELLSEQLVRHITGKIILAEQMLESVINKLNEITEPVDYIPLIDVSLTSRLAHSEYEYIGYILKYTVRAYFLRWHIPELDELNGEIKIVKRQIKKYEKVIGNYFKLAYSGKHVDISKIFNLQSAFQDILYMSNRLKMHIIDVFSRSV
jgi:hypothetical protein